MLRSFWVAAQLADSQEGLSSISEWVMYSMHGRVSLGRAIAQAVSRWLLTMAVRVRARVRSCRICGGRSGTGAGFLRVLRLSLPIFIPPIAPQSPSSSIWGWYKRPIVAAVPSELSLTPLIIIIIIIIKCFSRLFRNYCLIYVICNIEI
jgi:hypothetical protein